MLTWRAENILSQRVVGVIAQFAEGRMGDTACFYTCWLVYIQTVTRRIPTKVLRIVASK